MIIIASFEDVSTRTKQIVAYYPEWGVEHMPPYYVKQIEKSGAADKLTVLIYAFCEPAPDSTGVVEPGFKNAYEAYQQIYSAEMSIDGVADDSTQPLRGQFNQLKKLKLRHPGLKILISIGGWEGSAYFSDALLTPQSREGFADAIIDRYILGNIPLVKGTGGKGAGANIFDGVDIDWEYPLNGGLEGNHHDSNDNENLSAFYALMRKKLDSVNPELLLTAAVPASEEYADNYDIRQDQKYLNWYNLMTYDFVGEWSPVTNHHTNLFISGEDTSNVRQSFDSSVRFFVDSLGVNNRKIVPGVAFYGHGWKGVDSSNNGLYQLADGAAPSEEKSDTRNYSYWSFLRSKGFDYHWDTLAMAPFLYGKEDKMFWSFDDAKSIALKSRYVDAYHLGGIMCWEISGDDSCGTLINAMYSGEMPDVHINHAHPSRIHPPIALYVRDESHELTEGSDVIISAEVNDQIGPVVKVEFFVDDKSIGYDTESPFDWVWFNAHHGRHTIKAIAIDRCGNKSGAVARIKISKEKS